MILQQACLSMRRIFQCALVLIFVASAKAQSVTNVIDNFDPSGFGANTYSTGKITNVWKNWFGSAFQSVSWDAAMDANINAGSGSLKIMANFGGLPAPQFEVYNGFGRYSPGFSAIQFTNFQCDIRFETGSAVNGSGSFGSVQFGTVGGGGQHYFSGGTSVPASNTNWVHVNIALNGFSSVDLQDISCILIHIYDTSLSGPSTLWVDNIKFVGMATNSGTVTINYTNTQQRIDGYGASSAWMSTALSTVAADFLFSTNTGAGLSLLRTRIAPGGVIDDAEGTIAQQARDRGARVWSTPWSPAIAFKDSGTVNGGKFVSSVANYQGYAAQLAKYVTTMKNSYGVNLYAVSVQNEPDVNTTYESCVWTNQQIHDFVPYLDASLIASNVASTKLMVAEDEYWQTNLIAASMNDPATSNQVDILAAHYYSGSLTPFNQFGTPTPKSVWETEHYLGSGDDITNGLAVAQELHFFMTAVQANAYHYWWLTGSGNGSIIGNNTASPAKRLFAMGNYSRFVRPNYFRIGATNTSVALVSAYKDTNSASFVIVAANATPYPVPQTFVLTNFPALGTLTQWVTSASLSLSNQGPVTPTGNTFTYTLPAWTVVSFVYTQPQIPVIVQQPVSQTNSIYGTANFDVVASSSTPLVYQWLFNSTNLLAGETNASLSLTSLALADAGNYSVIVSNYAGSVTSAVAVLTITTNADFVLKADDGFGASSFSAIGNWTNTATGAAATFAPTNGYTYATGPFVLRTPASAGNYTFAGDALTISSDGEINIKGGNGNVVTFSNLISSGTINNSINANQNVVLAGNMIVLGAATLNTESTNSDIRAITNFMNLSGNGTLTNTSLGVVAAPGTVVLAGNNTLFTGALIVNGSTILQATSQANLGGNPATFNASQLVLDKGTLQPLATMTLSNANSGVTIGTNGGTFKVGSGIALTNLNPIAGSGNLVCLGGGTLVLAGTNTITGNLTVSNSTLALVGNASLNNFQLSISNNATLDVTALAMPLAISNKITLAGNLLVTVNSAGTSSKLVASNLFFGGALAISNSGPAFAAGNTFTLFAATNYSGVFTNITPSTPGAGLVWDTSKLAVNGTIQVGLPPAVNVTPASTNIIYGNMVVFTANVTGTSPLTYQWYDSRTNIITGAVFQSLTNTPIVAASGNYTVIVTNAVGRATNFATLTVSKATLVVTANNTNRVYGAANPVFKSSYSGFVNGDTSSVVTGASVLTTTATSNSMPGNYVIAATNGTLAATNYNFTFVNGTLAILSVSYPTNIAFTISGSTLNLKWPVSHLGWILQTNSVSLANSNFWFPYPGSTTLTNVSVTIDPLKMNAFYRLVYP